jgi:cell division protein FtsW
VPRQLKPDAWLLVSVTVLVGLGLSMVWSASAIVSLMSHGSPYYFFFKHLLWVVIGFAALRIAYSVDYSFYRKYAMHLFMATGVLLVLVLVPGIGASIGGVKRWFHAGPVSFQPSELAKLSAMIFLSASISVSGERLKEFGGGLLPNLIMVGFICALIMVEPDLGSTISVFAVSMIFLFLGGARFKHLAVMGLLGIPVFALSIFFKPYQMKRLMAFLDPWKDPGDSGFQIIQSMVALGHGGLKGLGLGDGWQKLFFLPAAHTDFVLSVIGEELGLIGILVVFALFGIFWWRGMEISLGAPDDFGRYLAMGITVMIVFQAAVNAGVVVGILPTKGLAMPFLSYGGTSLLINLYAVGILSNISQYRGAA